MAQISSQSSLNRHLTIVIALGVLLVGGVGGWAATTSLSSAVVADASVIFDDNVKKVQHKDGGIISNIYVREGQKVNAGDILLTLDGTSVRANLEIVESSLAQLYLRRARLDAERRGASDFKTDILVLQKLDGPERQPFIESEKQLLKTRVSTLDAQRRQLEERKSQLRDEIEGTDVQLSAIKDSIDVLDQELKALDGLYKRNMVSMQRVNDLKRQRSSLMAQRGDKIAARAQANGKMTEIDFQIIQLYEDRRVESSKELTENESKIAEFEQRRLAARDQLNRLNVTANTSGRVFQLNIHTVGGVVTPADTLMLIAPETKTLTVEAKVATKDIDQLTTGQPVDIRFTAFDQRTTPEVNGRVTSVAPDIVRDEHTGATYYPIRITPDAESLAKLKFIELYPGMPAEVFIKIGDRTVLSYLAKPLTDQIQHAFREE
jgi:membrane fusion protein